MPGFPTIAVAPATMVAAGGTCVTYVDPASLAIAYLFPSIAPTWSWTLPLPNAPLLRGITVAAQAWYGPSGNPAGFEVSNGVYLTLDY